MDDGNSRKVALCRQLSGFEDVSQRFATAALEELARHAGARGVEALLTGFDAGGAEAIVSDPVLQRHVRKLIAFLYTGFGEDGMPNDTPENHFESLMWRAALAHPPALSGGYFGHWSYPPEEANR